VPNYSAPTGSVSLGIGGILIVQFTDNSLTTSGDTNNDLWVFEIGGVVELFNVAISVNATDWIDLGNVLGQPTGLDIDGVAGGVASTLYRFVRLTDIAPNQSGSPFGEADIDAVGAISSGAAVIDPTGGTVPVPTTILLLGLGLASLGWSRRKKA